MSRVFLAEEVGLHRRVVVKVLPPEMAASVNQDRFRREIQLAAGLQHPHIVPVHSAGSQGDLLWYTMPYIEGESLRAKLARGGELPIKDALLILREVADALAYAHLKGVVHRDIKPDNVMLSGKHALVTDFGVAKAVTAATGAGVLTSLGMALGTPAYMAPEQAAGEANVDHRADLYALGAMAYEMLTGQPPFMGINAQALLAASLTQAPTPVTAKRPAVPPGLEAVVMRCLEKRAADRWQSTSELLPHLEGLLTPMSGMAPVVSHTISSGTEAALRQTHPVRVGALFGLAAVAVLSLTWWLVRQLGLPDWVVTAAGVLLVLGLPIVLLAARSERRRLMARTQGIVVPTPTGLAGRLSTVRGAVAGGGLAFGGLALGAAAFMGLRIMGIGPFATLVSAGVLEERGLLVVAEFETTAEDSLVAASMTEALKIDLGQSQALRLLEGTDVVSALRRMELPADTRLDAEVARSLAQREGAKAVVVGEVSRLGEGYVLAVRLISSADGSTLLGVRESAADGAGLIGAVDRISNKLREGIGESLRTIRASEPLEQVTTSSLEALRLYTQAQHARDQGGRLEETIQLLEQAIGVDSNFAMAWRRLAAQVGNLRRDPARAQMAAERAYQLRDRLPPREAELATAFYFHRSGNRAEAIRAYERLLARWPDDQPSRNNLALLLNMEGRYPEAESRLRETIAEGATIAPLFDNLIDAQLLQQKYPAAESTAVLYAKVVPEASEQAAYFRAVVRYTTGDYDAVQGIADTMLQSGDRLWSGWARGQKARVHLLRGQVQAARALEGGGSPSTASGQPDYRERLDNAAGEAYLLARAMGQHERARTLLARALQENPLDSIPPLNRNHAFLMMVASVVGRPDLVRSIYQDYTRSVPAVARRIDGDDAWARSILAAEDGKWQEAIDQARRAKTLWGCSAVCLYPEIGAAFVRMGQPDSAIAAFRAYLDRPIYFDVGQEVDQPLVLTRLAELYEAKGDKAQALEYYGRFVGLWKDADPELQSRVTEIKRRIARLAGEPGS